MDIFVGIILAVGFITLIGHGIWVVAAWVLRGGRPRQDRAGHEPTLNDDRAAVARYLQHLESYELIDATTRAHWMRLVAKESRESLNSREPAPYSPISSPVETPFPDAEDVPEKEEVIAELWPTEPTAPPPIIATPTPAGTTPEKKDAFDRLVAAKSNAEPARFASPVAPMTPAPPPEPRRPLSEVLAGFMAEKNIRWGELIGGLLIICCSTALVISLWSRIESIPILKFIIFTVVTSALAGAGLFIHHRWKLPTTGHAILVVSTMLVPLNLLAFSAFSSAGELGGGVVIGLEAVAIALFGWLTLLAGRVVLPRIAGFMALGVMLLSIMSPIMRYWSPSGNAALIFAASIPVALYALVIALSWRKHVDNNVLEDDDARRILLQLGIQTFACLAPLGLLGYQFGNIVGVLRVLSPVLCAMAGPALMIGLLLWKQFPAKLTGAHRTTAAAIALVASAVMLLGVAAAWPVPSSVLPALLVNAVAMSGLAWKSRRPEAHCAAAAVGSLILIIATQLALGGMGWNETGPWQVTRAMLSVQSGLAMILPVAACSLAAIWLARRDKHTLSRGYAYTSIGLYVTSATLLTVFGFGRSGNQEHASVVWGYAALVGIGFFSGWRMRNRVQAWCTCAVLLLLALQAVVFGNMDVLLPWSTALLAYATVCIAIGALLAAVRSAGGLRRTFGPALNWFGGMATVAVLGWTIHEFDVAQLTPIALRAGWLAGLWLAIAAVGRSPAVFFAGQLALYAAAALGTHGYLRGLEWYGSTGTAVGEPRVWQSHILSAGLLCVAWGFLRWIACRGATGSNSENGDSELAFKPKKVLETLLSPVFPAADQVVSGFALMALGVLALWGVWPAAASEHGWQNVTMPFRVSEHAAGLGAWFAAAVVAAALAFRRLEGQQREAAIGGLLLITFVTALTATRFEAEHHVVSAWRSLSAIAFLLVSAPMWWRPSSIALLGVDRGDGTLAETVHQIAAALLALPAIALTVTAAIAAAQNQSGMSVPATEFGLRLWVLAPLSPIVISLLGQGAVRSRPHYAIVMTLLAASACVCAEMTIAVRAGGSLAGATLSPIWLLQLTALVFAGGALIWHLLMNALRRDRDATGMPAWPLLVYRGGFILVLIWVGWWIWVRPEILSPSVEEIGGLWGVSSIAAIEAAVAFACKRRKQHTSQFDATIWLFFGAVIAACACERWDSGNWLCFHVLMIGLAVSAAARLAAGIQQERRLIGPGWQETFDTAAVTAAGGSAAALPHDLTCVQCGYNLRGQATIGRCPECNADVAQSREAAMSRLTPAWAGALSQLRRHTASAGIVFVLLASIFAVRGHFDDPQRPWWSIGVLVFLIVPCFGLAVWRRSRGWAYIGAIQWNFAACILLWTHLRAKGPSAMLDGVWDLLPVNIVALSAAGLAWIWVERRFIATLSKAGTKGGFPPLQHISALFTTAGTLLLAVISVVNLLAADSNAQFPVTTLIWSAWGATTALVSVCAGMRVLPHAAAGLYLMGLSLIGLLTARFTSSPNMLAWLLALEFSGYALLTAFVIQYVRRKSPPDSDLPTWLFGANGVLCVASLSFASYVAWTHSGQSVRFLVSAAPALACMAAWQMARAERRSVLQTISLHFSAACIVLLSWAWIAPYAPGALVQRAVATACAISVTILIAGLATKLLGAASSLIAPIRRSTVTFSIILVAAVGFCAFADVQMLLNHVKPETVTIHAAAFMAALGLSMASCVAFALHDPLDPLRAPAGAKGAYIYAAEIIAAVLGLHVRASMPWLFSGTITQYWPLLVMGLAFAAMCVGELSERRGLSVLSKPLGHTGSFLPVLAMLDVLISVSVVDFSIVLLTAGAFYAVSAALRKSVFFAMLASAAFTGSLWYYLHHMPGLDITRHPQLWFIPPALAVLAAGHFNRARLSARQLRSLNFACLIAVYVSSTADVFLIGVANAPWLPLVLGGLSVAGVIVGIAFRIRSFLQMGTGFLCLALFTIIWHAAEDLGWTWVWYVAGIALGVLIITMFALFEKKRAEMTALLKGVKEWEG